MAEDSSVLGRHGVGALEDENDWKRSKLTIAFGATVSNVFLVNESESNGALIHTQAIV